MNESFIIYLLVMFAVTYLIRVLPLTIIRGRIKKQVYTFIFGIYTLYRARRNDIPGDLLRR